MRRSLLLLLAFGLMLLPGCRNSPCSEWLCANDGKLYCGYLPLGAVQVDLACCPGADSLLGTDASLPASLDGALPAGVDAAVTMPGDGGAPPASADGGVNACPGLGDGGLGWFASLMDAGLLPTGRDDAGIPFIYQCGIDICHNPGFSWLEDAGFPYLLPDASNNCGPLGCH
jgi:hypothetical protein